VQCMNFVDVLSKHPFSLAYPDQNLFVLPLKPSYNTWLGGSTR
jgi:hypothetical protein